MYSLGGLPFAEAELIDPGPPPPAPMVDDLLLLALGTALPYICRGVGGGLLPPSSDPFELGDRRCWTRIDAGVVGESAG